MVKIGHKIKKITPKMPFWLFLMAKTGGRKNDTTEVALKTVGRFSDTLISQQWVEIFLNPFRSDVLGVSLS